MAEYDSNDLKSTLAYIKDGFGLDAFTKPGRVTALLSDLAPGLKRDRSMLERMSSTGILKDLAANTYENVAVQKRIAAKSMTKLTEDEFIRPEIAALYIRIVTDIFGWKIEIEIPQATGEAVNQNSIDAGWNIEVEIPQATGEAVNQNSIDAGWNIEVEIPRETHVQKMEFNLQRYREESEDRNFLLGKKALYDENFDEAILQFKMAFCSGIILAAVYLGITYWCGYQNYDEAVPFFVKGMQWGCPLSAEWLAEAYRTGHGISKDTEKAGMLYHSCAEALEAMCASGCAEAQYVLGQDLLYGIYGAKDEAKAYYWLEKARKAGHVCAGVMVARIFLYGWGQEKNEAEGVRILEGYSATTERIVHYELGKIYYYGRLKEKDNKKALYHFNKAAKRGHAISQVYMGDMFYYGNGVPVNYSAARKWYLLSEKQDNTDASRQLGVMYCFGKGVSVDYGKALKYFEYSADQGDARAQYYMGNMFCYGYGVPVNYSAARKWYLLSEKQGNTDASRKLGVMYACGRGVSADYGKALKYLKYSADKGDAGAQYILSSMYLWIDECKNYELGKLYLEKSAEQGFVEAQNLLARLYCSGQCFSEDDEKFVYWIRKAAEQNHPESQRILGQAYIELGNEEVLPKSYPDAVGWLEKAFVNGNIKAAVYLAKIYSSAEGYKDALKFSYYSEEAERLMAEKEKNGDTFGEEHESLADLLYKYSDDSSTRQKAFDHYCRAFQSGQKSVLYDLGWMYFVNGYSNDFFALSQNELLQTIISEEEGSTTSGLAYLLGVIYSGVKGVRENKAEAEKWYLKAVDKGSLSAACKLARYYIDERQMYEDGFHFAEIAYKGGSAEGAYILGFLYRHGLVPSRIRGKMSAIANARENRSKAKALLKESAEKGNQDAANELKKFLF